MLEQLSSFFNSFTHVYVTHILKVGEWYILVDSSKLIYTELRSHFHKENLVSKSGLLITVYINNEPVP